MADLLPTPKGRGFRVHWVKADVLDPAAVFYRNSQFFPMKGGRAATPRKKSKGACRPDLNGVYTFFPKTADGPQLVGRWEPLPGL